MKARLLRWLQRRAKKAPDPLNEQKKPQQPDSNAKITHLARQLVTEVRAAGYGTYSNGSLSSFQIHIWEPTDREATLEVDNIVHRWSVKGPLNESDTDRPAE